MQQHQPHEAFFSFTVPPKPTTNTNSHLLSSIITKLDSPHYSPSPSTASPTTNPSSANRPATAGPFAFNLPTSSTSLTHHPPTLSNHHRPLSSSDLPLSLNNNPQTPSSSHPFNHHHNSGPHSSYLSSTHPLPPSAPTQISNGAINVHHSRPMTAPGAAWVGSHHHLGDGIEFASAHLGLFGQASPYSLQPTASSLSKTASADFPSGLRHATTTHSSPGPSSAHPGSVDPIHQAPHGSSSVSSDPDSIFQDFTGQSTTSPIRRPSGLGRPSLGTHSTESTPESPESSDADHSHQSLGYLHTMPPNNLYHPLRPNTHSGTSDSFGHANRFPSQTLQPRPTTGYPPFYDPSSGYASLHPQPNHYAPRPPIFPTHSSQIYATGAGQYSHGPGSLDSHGHERLYNFNILPGAPRKRARRRFDEVERLYDCNYPGCTKAYGTLNHLNAHISMQKHGPKRLPQEFKEIRKEWRARKKAEAEARASALKQTTTHLGGPEYAPESFRPPPNLAIRHDSSPSGSSSTSGSFPNPIRSPAVHGSLSAPPHSQQFSLADPQSDWFNDHRLHSTIDEQAEYITHHQPPHSSASGHPHLNMAPSIEPSSSSLDPVPNSFEEHRFVHGSNPNPPPPPPTTSARTLDHLSPTQTQTHLLQRPSNLLLLHHPSSSTLLDHS